MSSHVNGTNANKMTAKKNEFFYLYNV